MRSSHFAEREKLLHESDMQCVRAAAEDGKSTVLHSVDSLIAEYKRNREQRIEYFLSIIQQKRETYMDKLCP